MEFSKGYEFSIRAPNWIDPVTLNKVSLNQSLYVLFAVLFAITVVGYYAYFFLRDPKRPGVKLHILKPLGIFYLASFLGLSVVTLFIFCQNVLADIKNLSKLTLDQKREQMLLNHYYPFLQFCQKHIPQGSKLGFAVHDTYYDIYGRYFLFPRYDHVESEDLYIIVFHPEKLPEGEPFAIYAPAEYIILKKAAEGKPL
jgi:hypothetical protein